MRSTKDMVKDGQRVSFVHYKNPEGIEGQGMLWYKTECGFLFPVPIVETGTATYLAIDRAMMYMRYIRKYKADLEKWAEEANIEVETMSSIDHAMQNMKAGIVAPAHDFDESDRLIKSMEQDDGKDTKL